MIWTVLYGAMGAGCLGASIRRGCPRCVGYGLAMMVSWLVTTLAVAILPADRAPALIIPADGALALMIGAAVGRRADRKGVLLLELFGVEMVWHLAAWAFGFWGSWHHYAGLNVIYAAQVLVAGGSNVVSILADWRPGRGDRPRVDRLFEAAVAASRATRWRSET